MLKKGKTKKKWHCILSMMLTQALVFTFLPASVMAADSQADISLSLQSETSTEILPAAVDNLVVSLREKSSLTVTSDGYMRVYYDEEQIGVEYYDNSFNIISRTTIAMELSIWGGFYAGTDAYYIVEGQSNTDEDDDAEVIRVIKYSTEWERLGAASITSNPSLFGGEVRYPFDYGCVQFAEYGGTLFIVTGHTGYVDKSLGTGHQGFLMISVDEAEMTGQIIKSNLAHSFTQYIENDSSDLYVLQLSEGGRCTLLSKTDPDSLDTTSISVLDYGGTRTSSWAISTYASVDGMALSSDNILCIGTSIDQSQYDSVTSDTAHNIYLTVTPKTDFTEDATSIIWLTDFSGDGKSFVGLKITKVNDERFMISWEEHTREIADATDNSDSLSGWVLHYVFVDGDGNKISSEYTAAAPVSECQPVLSGSDVVYFASSSNMIDFYKINSSSGEFSKKIYRVAGENATWDIEDGVLTISGSGTVSVDTDVHYRNPRSSCTNVYYHSVDNTWKPISSSVEKMVIVSGITEISEGAFKGLTDLTEVTIQSGVETIGDEAFADCPSLRKITIPASVTSIGNDILWTGSSESDGSHDVDATIYCEEGSVAESYAKENGIDYVGISEGEIENHSVYGTSVTLSDIRLMNTDEGIEVIFDGIEGTQYYCIRYNISGYDSTVVWQLHKSTGEVSDDQESYTKVINTENNSGDTYTVYVQAYTSDGLKQTGAATIKYLSQPEVSVSGSMSEPIVKWDSVEGAESYLVYRRTIGSDWVELGTTTETSYTDNTANADTIYYYTVQAISGVYRSSADIEGACNCAGDTLMVRRGNIFYFTSTLKGGNADYSVYIGTSADQVLVGDWDGDGIDTICLRYENICYFLDNSMTYINLIVTYGRSGDEVLVGDWDGDGCDSLAMRRNGNYYYFCNDTTKPDGSTWSATYGRAADEVHVGDWEDRGYDSLAVRRDGNVYYFSLTKVTEPDGDVWMTTFGRSGDEVLVGDWDGNGTDTLAMRRNGNNYYISNSIADPDSGVDTFTFGRASDEVYAGKWK